MAFKRIRVYDGDDWLQVGSQVPGVADASGSGDVTLDANGEGSTSLGYGGTVFNSTPFVFVQVTGVNHATTAITADEFGFTLDVKGEANDTISFSWFAVLVEVV